jgi:2-aminoadipate transaminase
MKNEPNLARRAAGLSSAFPAPHFPSELDAGVIAFDSGFAFPELLPDLTSFAMGALTTHREESLQYSAPQGDPALRGWIAGYMKEDGCRVTHENIFIVNGAKNGLDLICRLLLDEGDALIVSAPTYFTAVPIFKSFGAQIIEVGQDAAGILVTDIEAVLAARLRDGLPLPKFIYNVSDFHNPTGLTMPLARRQALVELSERHDMFIVEDNPYRRVRFQGESIPTLAALDRSGGVLHLGTFSKLIAPGLRIGWIAGRADLIARMMQLKADGGSNPLIQRIVLDFCSSPLFATHVRSVQETYRKHRDRMIEAVQRELPGVTLTAPDGGYYLWLTLPPHMNGDTLAIRAARAGVNIIPGSKFFAGSDERLRLAGRNHVRLAYSFATLEQIDEGLRRLARVYASQLAA